MQCEEARRLVLEGDLDAAELHVAGCEACFAYLEAADPVVTAIQAARPDQALAPAALARRVLARWTRRSAFIPPAWQLAAAAALLVAGAAALAAPLLESFGTPFEAPLAVLLAIASVPQKLLLANPAFLAALIVLGSGACVASAHWYQDLALRRIEL